MTARSRRTPPALRWKCLPGIFADVLICFGQPLVEGRCIPVQSLVGPFRAGDCVALIARWFDTPVVSVETAIRASLHPRYAAFEKRADDVFERYGKSRAAWWKRTKTVKP